MIQSRIKFDFLVRIIACDFYFKKLLIPIFPGNRQIFIEIILRCFSSKITGSTFHAYT